MFNCILLCIDGVLLVRISIHDLLNRCRKCGAEVGMGRVECNKTRMCLLTHIIPRHISAHVKVFQVTFEHSRIGCMYMGPLTAYRPT